MTLTVVDWVDIFTREEYCMIVVDSLAFCRHSKGLNIHAWCLMTNHLHMIVSAKEGYLLDHIMRDFKKFTSRALLKAITENPRESRRDWMLRHFLGRGVRDLNQVWQYHNHPIELITPSFIQQKLDYIHNNPMLTGWYETPEHCRYSSAKDYAGEKGLLEIDFLF